MNTAVRWYDRVVAGAPAGGGSYSGPRRTLHGQIAGPAGVALPAAVSAILGRRDSAALIHAAPLGFKVTSVTGRRGPDAIEVASGQRSTGLAQIEAAAARPRSMIVPLETVGRSRAAGVPILRASGVALDRGVSAPALAAVTGRAAAMEALHSQSALNVPLLDAFGRVDWMRKEGGAAWASHAAGAPSAEPLVSQTTPMRTPARLGMRAMVEASGRALGGGFQSTSRALTGASVSDLDWANASPGMPFGRRTEISGSGQRDEGASAHVGSDALSQFQSLMLEVVPRASGAVTRGADQLAPTINPARLPETARASDNVRGRPRTSDQPSRFEENQADAGSVVALRGDVLMDGRRMGRLVASGQVSAANLPQVSASSVNLRASPVFSGTSVAL